MSRNLLSTADDYRLISALFIRLLALIYLAAFVSIGIQILGLAGSQGIAPLAPTLDSLRQAHGLEAFWMQPSLFWIDAGDSALRAAAAAGALSAVLLFFNVRPRTCLIALFLLYLSLTHAGWVFMNFQWDYLLLESGFLAIFLCDRSKLAIWLFRWLLFRFRFLSGAAKLLSQDPTWASLSALSFYFEVQPLPHVGAWYAHQLPEWLLRTGAGATLVVELLIPFMMFMPRGPRFVAAWATIGLQVLILFTSNHSYFNLLTIALCLFLFDDKALSRVMPRPVTGWLTRQTAPPAEFSLRPRKAVFAAAGTLILTLSAFQIWEMFSRQTSPEPFATVLKFAQPWHIVHKYHVFPTMKTERLELVVEGSQDGERWEPYRFRYKPGEPERRPAFIVPHQPRLDWMMWFVPMAHPLNLTWYENFLYALLEGSPAVLDLLEYNPFPETPPRYLRTTLYRYRFADPDTGQWWQREYLGPFFPLPWVTNPLPRT